MTDEERVKAKWPDAYANYKPMIASWVISYEVRDSQIMGHEEDLGFGSTEAEAWSDAARRIEEGKNG